jgi:hypothetical protein
MTDADAPGSDPAQAAIDALSTLDLPNFVYWTVSMLTVPFGEQSIDPSAIACSYALRKVEDYLQAMREAEDRRYAIGAAVEEDIALAGEIRSTDPDSANALLQAALRRNDKTEIEIHFFAVAGDQIRRLLTVVTETLGVSLEESDEKFLFSYRPLRNQFEHLEERLPGIEKGGSIVLNETSAPSVLLGLRKDDVGRITVRHKGEDVVAEVNEFGYWHVERIVRETFERIHVACIDLLHQHFTENPEQIMGPAFYRPLVRRRFVNRDDE